MRFQTLTISSSPVSLTVPSGVTSATITIETANIRYRTDGSAPTTTEGHLAIPGDVIILETREEVTNFQAIRVTTDATIQSTVK